MNSERRGKLDKAWDLLDAARLIVEECKNEEEDAFYNLPEPFQQSERGEQMEEYISMLEDVIGSIDGSTETLSDIVIV